MKLLAADPRVDVQLPDYHEATPLWSAVDEGCPLALKWMLAELGPRLEVSLHAEGRDRADGRDLTPLETAMAQNRHVEVDVLQRYIKDPELTRFQLREELGLLGADVAGLFALVVFGCDGLLQQRQGIVESNPAARFFRIAQLLPMELQMVLCHRVFGSRKENVNKGRRGCFQSSGSVLDLKRKKEKIK